MFLIDPHEKKLGSRVWKLFLIQMMFALLIFSCAARTKLNFVSSHQHAKSMHKPLVPTLQQQHRSARTKLPTWFATHSNLTQRSSNHNALRCFRQCNCNQTSVLESTRHSCKNPEALRAEALLQISESAIYNPFHNSCACSYDLAQIHNGTGATILQKPAVFVRNPRN